MRCLQPPSHTGPALLCRQYGTPAGGQAPVNVTYRPQFWLDLEAGGSYLAERASPEIASRWHEEVRATVRRVETQPDAGRLRLDINEPDGRSTKRMSLAIHNLIPKRNLKVLSWISGWQSRNQDSA